MKMPIEDRTALFEQMISNENWIIEGVYYKWVQSSFEKADLIYVLDFSGYLCKYRGLEGLSNASWDWRKENKKQ